MAFMFCGLGRKLIPPEDWDWNVREEPLRVDPLRKVLGVDGSAGFSLLSFPPLLRREVRRRSFLMDL